MFRRYVVLCRFKSGSVVEVGTRAHSAKEAADHTIPLFRTDDTLVSFSVQEDTGVRKGRRAGVRRVGHDAQATDKD